MSSSDGKTRDLLYTVPGQSWDFGMRRHHYFEMERPMGPHYTVYNRRHMCCFFDKQSVEDGYWLLRQKAAVLHTGELPWQFEGPDAEKLLDLLFTKDITKIRPGRCGYGLACYEDGGLLTDGVLLRLAEDKFWYAQADGDFYSWARAHSKGMDVKITDPDISISQVQGPKALEILETACDDGIPEKFTYFACKTVRMGGQEVVVTRTGYTNELGWEFYTEPHHDVEALWAHIVKAGEPHGMEMFGLDSMNIRRIEAGIQNAGSDFDMTTTPYAAGLGVFVDEGKGDFIGKAALTNAPKFSRHGGLQCPGGTPLLKSEIRQDSKVIGKVTAAEYSPYLKTGIGYALLNEKEFEAGLEVQITCTDGNEHDAKLVSLPMYDAACEIPRGKLVDIPRRD